VCLLVHFKLIDSGGEAGEHEQENMGQEMQDDDEVLHTLEYRN